MREGETVGWHHQFNGHEFERTPGDSEGQGSLACCSPWDHKELNMTEQEQQQFWKFMTGSEMMQDALKRKDCLHIWF